MGHRPQSASSFSGRIALVPEPKSGSITPTARTGHADRDRLPEEAPRTDGVRLARRGVDRRIHSRDRPASECANRLHQPDFLAGEPLLVETVHGIEDLPSHHQTAAGKHPGVRQRPKQQPGPEPIDRRTHAGHLHPRPRDRGPLLDRANQLPQRLARHDACRHPRRPADDPSVVAAPALRTAAICRFSTFSSRRSRPRGDGERRCRLHWSHRPPEARSIARARRARREARRRSLRCPRPRSRPESPRRHRSRIPVQ